MNDVRSSNNYLTNLEKMYVEDTNKLRIRIAELETERDLWKYRCLESETENKQNQRQLRHV